MERIEIFVSRMIEGWSARLFRAKLQPVQIAKRVIRTMESHQTISLSKTFVPNSYVVSLSERDFGVAPGDIRVSCALVDASGEEVEPESPSLGAVEAGHTMVLDREALLRERPRAPKATLDVRDGGRGNIPLGPEPLLIGRDEQNDVVLDDPRVSRKHAEIRLRLGRYTLYDLQSTNGTWVNGKRIAEVVLNDGDHISVAGLELVFHSAD